MVSKERFFQKWKLKILITILSLCATNEIYWKCWNIWKKNPTRCINVSIITVKYVVISPGSKMIFCKNNLYSNKIVFIPVFIAFEFHELIAHRHHLRATRTTRGAKKKKLYARYITQSNVSRPVSMIILWLCIITKRWYYTLLGFGKRAQDEIQRINICIIVWSRTKRWLWLRRRTRRTRYSFHINNKMIINRTHRPAAD